MLSSGGFSPKWIQKYVSVQCLNLCEIAWEQFQLKSSQEFGEQSLQYLALQIVKDLDELERIGRRYPVKNDMDDWSYNISPVECKKIDLIKIDIVNKLLELRRKAGIAITLPTTLEIDHFISVNDANQNHTKEIGFETRNLPRLWKVSKNGKENGVN